MIRRVQGVNLGNESQMAARSLAEASKGPEKHIPLKGRGQMNVTGMKRVYEETVQSAAKFFGGGLVREAANVCRWEVEISRRHPTDLAEETVRPILKPKVGDQRR